MAHKQVDGERAALNATKTTITTPTHSEDVVVHRRHAYTPSTSMHLLSNFVQFIVALLVLKFVSLERIAQFGVLGFLVVYFATQLHMGPNSMSPRRKMMISSFGPPDSGTILGTLTVDVTKTRRYIEEKRQATGSHITVTHLVLRAMGTALANAPSINGHIVFGRYYESPTVNISALVAIEGGKDLGISMLSNVDQMTLQDISETLQKSAGKLRTGKDKGQSDRNKMMAVLPTWAIRLAVNVSGWLGNCLGLRIKPVGVEPYMFGSCMVTSVGMMNLELAFAPLTPYAQTPMLVTIGSIKDTPVVVDGQVVARPILTLTTTIDHRYVDGSQAARIAKTVRDLMEDPYMMEPIGASS